MPGRGDARLQRRGPRNRDALTAPGVVEHFFRHEYGRLVATLSRRFGGRNIESIEDAVQSALLTALENWPRSGVPENPPAWLFRVAYNHLLGELRRNSGRQRLLERNEVGARVEPGTDAPQFVAEEIPDDLLRMLFVCCDDAIPVESQLVLALKTLCGFDVREIALRLFTTEANVYKRLARARSRLRETPLRTEDLPCDEQASRLPAVHRILYLLFTEGYLSSHGETAIRRELCEEAIRLTTILAEHPVGAVPETFALLSLMHLHTARAGEREDDSGGLLLLEDQNRARWDRERINIGLEWLARSAEGDRFSRYHAEAGVAAEHCLAASYRETRWEKIVECYALLEQIAPSALHRLNRAVAMAEWQGPQQGLAVLAGFEPPTWLAGSYLWAAVLADLHRRCGHGEAAKRFRDIACDSAPTPAVKLLLARRLDGPHGTDRS